MAIVPSLVASDPGVSISGEDNKVETPSELCAKFVLKAGGWEC